MKQSTLTAIISIIVLVFMPLVQIMIYKMGLGNTYAENFLYAMAYLGLLPFFIKLYQKQ